MTWAENKTLQGGKYRIEKVLGEGGFGITYKAIHNKLGAVVIKTPNDRLQRDPDYQKYLQRFDKEARQLFALGRDRHPYIVRVSDMFEEEGLLCIVMDFIEGESLFERVRRKGALPEAEVLNYIRQVGSALEVVHSQQLVHRDAHPGNIMIVSTAKRETEAILIDFGIAGEQMPSTVSSKVVGNPTFAPYEQSIKPAQPNMDIYCLAASFYYGVTGKLPTSSLNRKMDNQRLIPPKVHNPRLSDRSNSAILKGMALEPSDRPATMTKWLQQLDPSSSPTRSESRSSWTRREVLVALEVLLGFLVALGGLGRFVVGWLTGQEPDKEPDPEPQTPNSEPRTPNPELQSFTFETVQVDNRGNITKRFEVTQRQFVEDLGNGVELAMVLIPGGTFTMGSPESEAERDSDEGPQHQVTVPEFYMGKYEVTQAQYEAIMGTNPSNFKGDGRRPVEKVSWNDAVAFCEKLSQRTGRKYRLPTEAEWEYACRAGTETPFYFGETITPDLVNYNGNDPYGNAAEGQYRRTTTSVGSFPPNGFGLYDMHGNVWEWCSDGYHDSYAGKPESLKQNGSISWPSSDEVRLLRGGSWLSNARHCRSALRNRDGRVERLNRYGFRVAASLL
jgi:formylglycine-generating enzyme required for sulfatase activity/tRNA A-37 threonylcarbamoyl transferase component Bud32